jgi:hypothetical protein
MFPISAGMGFRKLLKELPKTINWAGVPSHNNDEDYLGQVFVAKAPLP